jgi:hypothetical protein
LRRIWEVCKGDRCSGVSCLHGTSGGGVFSVFCRGSLLGVVATIFVVLGVFQRSEVLVLYCSAPAMLQIFFSTSVLVGSGCLFCCRQRPPLARVVAAPVISVVLLWYCLVVWVSVVLARAGWFAGFGFS